MGGGFDLEVGYAVEQIDNGRVSTQILQQRGFHLRDIDVVGAEVGEQDNHVLAEKGGERLYSL